MAAVAVSAAADDGGNSAQSQVAFILISIFCLAAAVLCGIIIAVNNFSYLYKKSQVDMIYSLPIKKKFKFLSDYASGLVIYSSEVFSINAGVYGKWVLFFLGATALYFLLTMFLYNRRKAEDVSKPYVFKLLYYIVVTVISMAISLIARYQFSMIFPVIIFSFI